MRSKVITAFIIGVSAFFDIYSTLRYLTPYSNGSNLITSNHTSHSLEEAYIPARVCGTAKPSDYVLHAHQELQHTRFENMKLSRATRIIVDVYFHIISTFDKAGLVKPYMVANQFGVLQQAYASSNVTFRLRGIDYIVNDTWATDQADLEMKAALRQGNYSTLNIYFQTNLSITVAGAKTQLLGYCTLPTNVTYSPCRGCALAEYPSVDYALDGCNVLAGTMPGGPVYGYNFGKTTVHEVGHWFGLLHTFQDTTCNITDPGDFIEDTPQESVSTVGCPVGKDSCPNSPGLDPIHNFMDYSLDSCYEGFTSEQVQRMQAMFGSLRFSY